MIDQEIAAVVRMRDEEGLSFREIAQTFKFSERTARRRYEAYSTPSTISTSENTEIERVEVLTEAEYVELPEIGTQVPEEDFGPLQRFEPISIYGDAIVVSDIHIPLWRPDIFNKMLASSRYNDHNQLIINGDLWHMELFSSFMPKQPEAAFPLEKRTGNIAVKTALNMFERVYLNVGNHDFRLVKKTGHVSSYEECMYYMLSDLTDDEWTRFHVTSLDHFHYYPEDDQGMFSSFPPRGRKYRVCHQDNFSTVPLSVPRALNHRYQCSIITGHSHHLALGFAQDGHNIIIESGGFFDANRTEYVQKTRKGHVWTPGWVEFVDGTPELKSPLLGNV